MQTFKLKAVFTVDAENQLFIPVKIKLCLKFYQLNSCLHFHCPCKLHDRDLKRGLTLYVLQVYACQWNHIHSGEHYFFLIIIRLVNGEPRQRSRQIPAGTVQTLYTVIKLLSPAHWDTYTGAVGEHVFNLLFQYRRFGPAGAIEPTANDAQW